MDDSELLRRAADARALAYVPYSGFAMGAAVLTDRGDVCIGTIVENVSLGLAMCAERVGLFSTVSTNAGRPVVLALVAPRTDGKLTHPCGACLQVALELGGPDVRILVGDLEGEHASSRVGDLLPFGPYKSGKA